MAETLVNTPGASGTTPGEYPNWINDPSNENWLSWNIVLLDDTIIPGVCSIEDLEVGIDVDTKKAKGADKPTSTDTGLKPAKFKIKVRLTSYEWPLFQAVYSKFQPRRPGRARSPLKITHPMVNFQGIQIIRVSGVKMDHPNAKTGMMIEIHCEEWFDKPVAVKQVNKPAAGGNAANTKQKYVTHTYYNERGELIKVNLPNHAEHNGEGRYDPSAPTYEQIFGED